MNKPLHPTHHAQRLLNFDHGWMCRDCGNFSVGGMDKLPGTMKFICPHNTNTFVIHLGKRADA